MRSFQDAIETFLVKWGWLIFSLGIVGAWLPFRWLYPVVLLILIACLLLMILLIVRFLIHASFWVGQKQLGRAAMFIVLMLPGSALFIWASLAEGSKWRMPDSWDDVAITTVLGFVTLLTIGLRWWYVSGNAIPKRKPSILKEDNNV